jgi:hypothetical protein
VELNRAWNGPVPSETTRDTSLEQLDRQLVYSANVILSCAADYVMRATLNRTISADDLIFASQLLFGLNTAWESVLAGDIDDLLETVQLEGEAKAPGHWRMAV